MSNNRKLLKINSLHNMKHNETGPDTKAFITCPVRRGVSAASFSATGLGVHTGQVYRYKENST